MTYNPAQRGFAAVAAIFLVVGLAALGAFMVTMSNTQQLTSAQDIQGTRAYWAARAGLEWAIVSTNATPVCPSATPFAVEEFTVTVRCSVTTFAEAGATSNIFQFTSMAKSSGVVGSLGYIERSVSASMEL